MTLAYLTSTTVASRRPCQSDQSLVLPQCDRSSASYRDPTHYGHRQRPLCGLPLTTQVPSRGISANNFACFKIEYEGRHSS